MSSTLSSVKRPHLQHAHIFSFTTVDLAIRVVLGWVYWGGFSRRFIYAPGKLHPNDMHHYLAGKLAHAAPGAALGVGNLIHWLLLQPSLLYAAIIAFTITEGVTGVFLILGFMTRFAAFLSLLLSITLMVIFGWMGTTCLDEWTMAATGFAISASMMLAGAGCFSIDNLLIKKDLDITHSRWFVVLFSGHMHINYKKWSIIFGIVSFVFAAYFYSYYRGAIFGQLTARVTAQHHEAKITNANLYLNDGTIAFNAYIDAGPDTQYMYIIKAMVVDQHGKIVEQWDGNMLADKKRVKIINKYKYSWFAPQVYGIGGELGADAQITVKGHNKNFVNGQYYLRLVTIGNQVINVSLLTNK